MTNITRYLALLVFTACHSYAVISAVNTTAGTRTDGSSCTASPLSATAANHTAGNLLAVGIRLSSTSAFDLNPTVTDTAGNTYLLASRGDFGAGVSGHWASVWMYYAKNITGNAANVSTVTFAGTSGTSDLDCDIQVIQYSGLNASSPWDVASSGLVASGSSVTSDSFTTVAADEVAVSMTGVGALAQTFTAGSGYTVRITSGGGDSAMQDKIVSSIQTGISTSMSWLSSTVEAGIAVAVFSATAISHPFDQYGGRVAIVCAGGSGPDFYTEKINSRWWLCTPDGHGLFLQGVSNAQADTGVLPTTGVSYYDSVTAKYGDANINWGKYTSLRVKSWGFNSWVENTSTYVYPWYVAAGGARMPIIPTALSTRNAYINGGGYAATNHATKDIIWCGQNYSVYNGVFTGGFPDVFDPAYTTYITGRYADTLNQTSPPYYYKFFTDPYSVGTFPDDSDNLVGIGPDITAIGGPTVFHPNDAWLALASNPTIASCANPGNTGTPQTYADTVNYSKSQILTDLTTQYGTIGALNTAWGSTYTTFGSSGGWPKATTAGTGLSDEDGSSAWMGNHDGSGTSTNSTALADMNTFLLKQWRKYYTVQVTAYHTYSPKLFFSPVLNEDHGISRPQVLQAAGEQADVVTAAVFDQEILNATITSIGDVPVLYDQYIQPANPDSAIWNYDNFYGYLIDFTNQAEKAANLNNYMGFFLNATTVAGNKPVVGYTYWALVDSASEKQDFGLVSLKDNAYDGVESCVAAGTDAYGHVTGGEQDIPVWQSSHAYTDNGGDISIARSLIQAATGGATYLWKANIGGTSGGSTPNWASAAIRGQTVTDGGVTWENYGTKTVAGCFGNFIGPLITANSLWYASAPGSGTGISGKGKGKGKIRFR